MNIIIKCTAFHYGWKEKGIFQEIVFNYKNRNFRGVLFSVEY